MATAAPMSIAARSYEAAANFLREEKFVKAIIEAKYNLTDSTLPRMFQIANCIVIAHAEDDWDEAERYRKVAEDLYQAARIGMSDTDSKGQEGLQLLRRNLDELAETLEKQAPLDDDEGEADEEAELEDIGQDEPEDADALPEAEKELTGPEINIINWLNRSLARDAKYQEWLAQQRT